MNIKALTETDIRSKYITPALTDGGKWDLMTQVREEVYFTKGRVIVRGKTVRRGEASKADYVLSYRPNLPIAVIEAKDNNHAIGAGMQQALAYAETLDVPFAYSSNGDGFLEHDRTVTTGTIEREIALRDFPTPEELWERYCAWKGLISPQQVVVMQDYHTDVSGKSPRYYQLIAINRTVDAIARGEKRILLVMATGTGKTYTAFQEAFFGSFAVFVLASLAGDLAPVAALALGLAAPPPLAGFAPLPASFFMTSVSGTRSGSGAAGAGAAAGASTAGVCGAVFSSIFLVRAGLGSLAGLPFNIVVLLQVRGGG